MKIPILEANRFISETGIGEPRDVKRSCEIGEGADGKGPATGLRYRLLRGGGMIEKGLSSDTTWKPTVQASQRITIPGRPPTL